MEKEYIEYKRKFLLENNMMPKKERWVTLVYGKHSSGRNEQRKVGTFDVLPQKIKVCEENIMSLYFRENKSIKKTIIRLNYSHHKWLYLVIVDDYFVKTIWWRDKKENYVNKNTYNTNMFSRKQN